MVMIELPDPPIVGGLKDTVTPEGWPVAARDMPEAKPFVTAAVIVDVPVLPCTTDTVVGEAVRPKPGVSIVLISPLIVALPLGLPHPVAKSYPTVAG